MNSRATTAKRPDALHLRKARPGDAPILCAAERETARQAGRLVSRPHELAEQAFAARIAALEGFGGYSVAECDGTIVAHGILEPISPLAAHAHVRALTIVVHPGFTRRGIGSALMQALLDHARRNEVEKIELRVRDGNVDALRLYRRFGFVEEGRSRRRVKLAAGSYLDDICMAWFATEKEVRS
jgi:L-phenylalanine/L-methionine N-acetyltransferase